MSAKNDVLCRDELDKCRDKLKKDVTLAIEEINNLSASILLDDSLHTIGWSDSLRALLLGLRSSEPAYRNLILNSVSRINATCSMAIPLYLLTIQNLLSKNSSPTIQKRLLGLVTHPTRVSSKKIIREWESSVHDEYTIRNKSLFIEAVYAAGALGSIAVEQTNSVPRVVIDCSSKFSCDAHQFFESEILDFVELDNCLTVIVDGAVIDVSEIHHLLTHAYENAVPVVMFASNYSDDVANTLAVNWHKGLVKVLPLIVNKELDNINQIKDICTVSGAIPVSKDTGLLISTLCFDEIPRVDVVYSSIQRECSFRTTKKNFDNIRRLRQDIQENLENEKIEDVKKILKKRLSKLSTRKATVKISCSKTELGILQDRAANLFQLLSCSGRQGIIPLTPIYDCLEYHPSRFMPSILPRAIAESAIRRAISDASAIDNIRAIIKLD